MSKHVEKVWEEVLEDMEAINDPENENHNRAKNRQNFFNKVYGKMEIVNSKLNVDEDDGKMTKQVAKYDQLKDVYVFMNEEKEMVVINADVVEQCVNQKINANEWIEKESNEYHESMKKTGGK